MIEVLFGESEAASMKMAKSKTAAVTPDEVICLAFMLDIGEIEQDVCSQYRKNLLYSMLNQSQWGTDLEIDNELKDSVNVYIKELERLQKFLENGEDIRIWYSKSAYSLCGLYYVCSLLIHYQNKIYLVELPEYRTIENIVISYQNWGEVGEDEFALFIDNQKEINQNEIKRYAQIWMELVADNSPLRTMLNNHVIGVKEDFYDFLIWKRLNEKPIKQARLIGNILGHYQISVGDWWYAKRIQYYIEQGNIEILEDSENKYARLIKRKCRH